MAEPIEVSVLLKRFSPANVDWKNPLPYALQISAYLSTLKHLKGKEKLELLQSILKKGISIAGISEQERLIAVRFVEDVLPIVVDAALSVSRGEVLFDSATVERVAVGCCLQQITSRLPTK
jgi:hypothetical protein